MTVRPLAAALLVAAALGVAACGDDKPAAAKPSDSERQAQVKFAECMRENGIDLPDPGTAGAGPVKIGGDATPEELRAAEKACAEFRKDIKPPELSDAQKQEFKDAALANARCMREHGVDFPDPSFSEDGGAQIQLGKGGPRPEDPEFKAAQKACAGTFPDELRQEAP
jgi:hypothetical protein